METEYIIQQTFCQWCEKQSFVALHWHIPNGMKSTAKEGFLFRKQGLRKGMPDYWVLLNNNKLLAIEFKTVVGTVSPDQKNILQILAQHGIPAQVCRSAYEAASFVKQYI